MKIKLIELKNKYRYLWLKYVIDFNLAHHCAKCLVGQYSRHINNNISVFKDIELNEYPYRYIYLCGVTYPYNWKNNLHLALKECEGNTVEYTFNGDRIIIEDAEIIDITDKYVYHHPNGIYKAYSTCRNWRFATQQFFSVDVQKIDDI